jgi:hypothetical protein
VQSFVVQLGHQLALLSGHGDVLLEPVAALLFENVLLFLAARLRQRPLRSRWQEEIIRLMSRIFA